MRTYGKPCNESIWDAVPGMVWNMDQFHVLHGYQLDYYCCFWFSSRIGILCPGKTIILTKTIVRMMVGGKRIKLYAFDDNHYFTYSMSIVLDQKLKYASIFQTYVEEHP